LPAVSEQQRADDTIYSYAVSEKNSFDWNKGQHGGFPFRVSIQLRSSKLQLRIVSVLGD
jgi:hypothetical protein